MSDFYGGGDILSWHTAGLLIVILPRCKNSWMGKLLLAKNRRFLVCCPFPAEKPTLELYNTLSPTFEVEELKYGVISMHSMYYIVDHINSPLGTPALAPQQAFGPCALLWIMMGNISKGGPLALDTSLYRGMGAGDTGKSTT